MNTSDDSLYDFDQEVITQLTQREEELVQALNEVPHKDSLLQANTSNHTHSSASSQQTKRPIEQIKHDLVVNQREILNPPSASTQNNENFKKAKILEKTEQTTQINYIVEHRCRNGLYEIPDPMLTLFSRNYSTSLELDLNFCDDNESGLHLQVLSSLSSFLKLCKEFKARHAIFDIFEAELRSFATKAYTSITAKIKVLLDEILKILLCSEPQLSVIQPKIANQIKTIIIHIIDTSQELHNSNKCRTYVLEHIALAIQLCVSKMHSIFASSSNISTEEAQFQLSSFIQISVNLLKDSKIGLKSMFVTFSLTIRIGLFSPEKLLSLLFDNIANYTIEIYEKSALESVSEEINLCVELSIIFIELFYSGSEIENSMSKEASRFKQTDLVYIFATLDSVIIDWMFNKVYNQELNETKEELTTNRSAEIKSTKLFIEFVYNFLSIDTFDEDTSRTKLLSSLEEIYKDTVLKNYEKIIYIIKNIVNRDTKPSRFLEERHYQLSTDIYRMLTSKRELELILEP